MKLFNAVIEVSASKLLSLTVGDKLHRAMVWAAAKWIVVFHDTAAFRFSNIAAVVAAAVAPPSYTNTNKPQCRICQKVVCPM